MHFDNLVVNHKSFGLGAVVSQKGNYITVKFGNTQKIFVYPDAFESFLTLDDGSVPEEIKSDIENAKRAKQAIRDKIKEENVRAMTKGIVIPGKEGSLGESRDGEEEEHSYKQQDTEEI